MRALNSTILTALQQDRLVARDFLWIVARTRDEVPTSVNIGLWSGIDTITLTVTDPNTNAPVTRTYLGAGTLIGISDIPLVSSLTIQNISISTSQLLPAVNEALRTYDCKQARVEIHRGLWNPTSMELIHRPFPRFYGFLDEAPIPTPKEGEEAEVTITATSHTQEITRSNPDTRSHASQLRRNATDNFMQDTGTIHEREFWWGTNKGKVATAPGVTGINLTTWTGGSGGGTNGGIGSPGFGWAS